MRIHIAAQNDHVVKNFTKNNPTLSNLIFHKGDTSILSLLETIINGEDDFALFVKDDVFLPSAINTHVAALIETLNLEWPNWGICGNSGITLMRSTGTERTCRYLFDLDGGPTLRGEILPAETIGQAVILINCKALRSKKFKLPAFEGTEFYELILSLETLDAEFSVLLAPQLACFQLSKLNQSEFSKAECPSSLVSYLSNKLTNRYITTVQGVIDITFKRGKVGRFDVFSRALVNASVGRRNASIAFVIRTQFRNIDMLKRSILSTLAFSAATDNRTITTYIVTDKDVPSSFRDFAKNIKIISVSDLTNTDTRNVLIREALRSIADDYVMFIDDDDWVFPNDAQTVSRLLTCLPRQATLVVDSQAFSEKIVTLGETDWRNSSVRLQVKFNSSEWALNFSGHNRIPVCGAFYSRTILLDQPSETFDTITYFEDFTASIYALLNPNSIFFSTPKTIAGISIRDVGNGVENTVNVSDRTKWSQSQAELAYHLCSKPSNNVAFAIGKAFSTGASGFRTIHEYGENSPHLNRLDRKVLVISRTLRGAIEFAIRPKRYKVNIQRYCSGWRQLGARGLVRAIADTR